MTKPTLKIEKNDDGVRLLLKGELTVQNSKALQELLITNINHQKQVHLVLDDVTALDVAGIQLVMAWKNEIKKSGAESALHMPKESSLLDLLEKTGITKMV